MVIWQCSGTQTAACRMVLDFRWRRFKLLSRESAARTSHPFCPIKAISSADERVSPAGFACGFTALMVYHVTTSSGKGEHETSSGSDHDFNTEVSGINRGLSPMLLMPIFQGRSEAILIRSSMKFVFFLRAIFESQSNRSGLFLLKKTRR